VTTLVCFTTRLLPNQVFKQEQWTKPIEPAHLQGAIKGSFRSWSSIRQILQIGASDSHFISLSTILSFRGFSFCFLIATLGGALVKARYITSMLPVPAMKASKLFSFGWISSKSLWARSAAMSTSLFVLSESGCYYYIALLIRSMTYDWSVTLTESCTLLGS